MALNIQAVTSDHDVAIIASLADEIWHQHFTPIIGREQVDYMLAKFQSVEAIKAQLALEYEYYFALKNNDAVGYICLIHGEKSSKTMLSKLYVKQSARNQGVGDSLLTFSKNRAWDNEAKQLQLTVNRYNQKTIEWYKRKNFVIIDEVKKDIDAGFYMDDYVMECEVRLVDPIS